MTGIESQEEDAPKRILFFKPMSCLGQIRSHRRDETWSASLWQTFFSAAMGAQIPVIAQKPLSTCGCRKFQVDPLGDHFKTYTVHSGAKKAHDWTVDQIADLFRTTHKVKTQQVVKSRGQHCGDIELAGYLANAAGPVPLVLDLRIAHDRVGSSTDPTLNGHLRYPNNLDQSLNDAAADQIRKYRADYNNRPPSAVSFMPAIATSGVLSAQSYRGFFHYRRAAFFAQLKSKVGLALAKAAASRITLNLDGAPIT
jgi:hypothetical protein